LTESLLESELFGHAKGSFTGSTGDHTGLFEEAREGTIFLDEIGEVSKGMQLKLLRVLQEREVLRVGETRPRKIDVRIIAASNQELEQLVAKGTFREDLYYRLCVVHIEVPPLRERREDILPLARHFVSKHAEILGLPELHLDGACLDYLLEYDWPGNVRELENAIEHAAVLCRDDVIIAADLPTPIFPKDPPSESPPDPRRSLAEVELEHIKRILVLTKGNRAEAAKVLGIGTATLYRKLSLLKQRETDQES
jgi:transcriptional regulator with PAS, ATPase and Fis domain